MREIKFRAWDSEKEIMFDDEVLNIFIHFDGQLQSTNLNGFIRGTYNTPKLKLMQYTGLKDKNGKEIYEGDIIEFNNNDYARTAGHLDDEIIIAKVEYYCGHYGLKEVNGQLHDLYVSLVNDEEAEIIGNIYENPELLEGDSVV